MIKSLLISLCFILSSTFSFANKVDDLKTDNDVLKFIVSIDTNMINPKYSKNIKIVPTEHILNDNNCDPNTTTWGIKNWVKTDFNNDGRTDLLVILVWDDYSSFVAIDKGNNTFQLIRIYYSGFEECELTNTIKKDNYQLVLFHVSKDVRKKDGSFRYDKISETDSLIYKFNDFVELNRNPANYKINSISFSTSGCFGTCPQFEINIDNKGHAGYVAGIYAEKEQGTYHCKVRRQILDTLSAMINYINIKNLKNNYDVSWTDFPTCVIKVKFSDGSVKEINDYGELGTFGLRALYGYFFKLRQSQEWYPVD
jgi:hypothetical protein